MNSSITQASGSITQPDGNEILYQLDGRPSLALALPIGLQHVFAMFTGNLAPILILSGVVGGLSAGDRLVMIQCAMLMAGLMTILQAYPL